MSGRGCEIAPISIWWVPLLAGVRVCLWASNEKRSIFKCAHHKKLKRLLHTSTLKIISQRVPVCWCLWWRGENENHHKYSSVSTCEIFHNEEKGNEKKKTQTQIYVFALQRRRLRNFPSLCFMLRFFFFHFIFSVVTKSLRLLSCPSISNTKHPQSGSRSSSNCNTNPLALSLRESVISVGKEQSWKINKKQKLARKFKKITALRCWKFAYKYVAVGVYLRMYVCMCKG